MSVNPSPTDHLPSSEPAGIKPRSLVMRAITAAGYAVTILIALGLGVYATGVLFGVMAAFAAAEFYAMERREARLPNELFGVAAAGAMPIAAALWGLPGLSATVTGLIAASLVWHTLFRRVRTADTATTVFGAVYTGFLLAYVVLVRDLDSGLALSVVLMVSVWANDVAAYFIGSLLGRHRLAPHISPKKSWEGFIAGSVATIAVWLAAALLERGGAAFAPVTGLTTSQALLTGATVAAASVIGDLAESRMKREAGVKDSGASLPGHGGFLDRLDSLILVCLVAYWVLHWSGIR